MKKPTDKDILKANGKNIGEGKTNLTIFRKQFQEYQRAKTTKQTDTGRACRPYSQVFHHTKIEEEP